MKKSVLLLLFLALIQGAHASDDTLKVLFIGNSITYFNDMPTMFHELSASKGKTTAVSMYAPGGTGFMHHVVDPNVYDLFRQEWDVVVLQPGSGESAGASAPVSQTVSHGQTLLDSLYTYNPCARAYLYEIPYGVPSESTWGTYFSVQDRIKDSVTAMADGLHLQMIPAGECAFRYYSMHQNLLLHGSYNDIHPNANGSFLVASACYATIFQENISGSDFYSSVQQDTAVKFFSIVDTVVLNRFPEWRINTWNLHADFESDVSGDDVHFSNTSVNATSVEWNFGDGSTSSETDPVHTYATEGTYTVTLYAWKDGCVDSTTKQVTFQSTVSLDEWAAANIRLYPNPVGQQLTVEIPEAITAFQIVATTGTIVDSGSLQHPQQEIRTGSLSAGVYTLLLSGNGIAIRERIVKE